MFKIKKIERLYTDLYTPIFSNVVFMRIWST